MGDYNSDSDDSDELGRLAYQTSKTAKLREASKTASALGESLYYVATNNHITTTTMLPETVGSSTLLNNSVTQTVLSSRDYPPVSSSGLGKREYSSSSVHKNSTTTKTPSSGGYEHEYYYDATTKRVVDATTKRVVAQNVSIKHDELTTSPIQQESLLSRPQIPTSQKECPKYSQNNNTNTKCPPPIFIPPKVGIISKKKQKDNSNKKHLFPTKPYTDYTMFFRLEQAYITQTTTGEVDPEVIKLLDPNHTDDVEFPRPEKYKDVIMPPYWYSSSHKKAAYKKRKHRKRKGSERLDLKALSKRISASWSDLKACAKECTEKKAILEYCRMLACSEVEKYQAKCRAQSRAQSMKEEHETQMVRVKEQQQRLQAMTRDAETGEQNQRKLAWAEFTSAEVTDAQGVRLLTAMKYAQTGLPTRDSSTR